MFSVTPFQGIAASSPNSPPIQAQYAKLLSDLIRIDQCVASCELKIKTATDPNAIIRTKYELSVFKGDAKYCAGRLSAMQSTYNLTPDCTQALSAPSGRAKLLQALCDDLCQQTAEAKGSPAPKPTPPPWALRDRPAATLDQVSPKHAEQVASWRRFLCIPR